MPTDRGAVEPFIERLRSGLSQWNNVSFTLSKKQTKKFVRLTRLVRTPIEELLQGASKYQKFVRTKARKLLSDIGCCFGMVVVFLSTQVTNETQLGFLDREEAIGEILIWRSAVSFSPHLISVANELQRTYGLKYPISPGNRTFLPPSSYSADYRKRVRYCTLGARARASILPKVSQIRQSSSRPELIMSKAAQRNNAQIPRVLVSDYRRCV